MHKNLNKRVNDIPDDSSTVVMRTKGICKTFKNSVADLEVLKDIDLEIQAGDTISVVGESGIGKSTLLHILGTLDRPDQGELIVNDKNVFKLNDSELARFRNESVGFVFQFHHLLPEFTAVENAMMPCLIKGLSKKKSRQTAEKILCRVGLKDRLDYLISKLSGGEQQRVALARAIVLNPMILLADEPTGNLDVKTSEKVHELLMELNKELKMTLVVVTHNMELARYMQRSVTIVDGKLQELA